MTSIALPVPGPGTTVPQTSPSSPVPSSSRSARCTGRLRKVPAAVLRRPARRAEGPAEPPRAPEALPGPAEPTQEPEALPVGQEAGRTVATETARDPLVAMARTVACPGTVTTWLNHWSVQHADWRSLERLDVVGVDGTLLQLALAVSGRRLARTSADLVLPTVLSQVLGPGARVALIGGRPGVAQAAAQRLSSTTVVAIDGFEDLAVLRADPSCLVDFAPELVVLGLGAGLQDEVAVELHEVLPRAAICTAGGWIDQLAASEQYFPDWVHRMRLGWAWRIAHEPRRLLGRYTVDAVRFLAGFPSIVRRLDSLGGRCTTIGFDLRGR